MMKGTLNLRSEEVIHSDRLAAATADAIDGRANARHKRTNALYFEF